MHVARWATAAVLCAFAIAPVATAQQTSPPPDAAKLPPPAAKYEHAWPKVLPNGTAAEAPPQAPATWSKQEIELAQGRYRAMLKVRGVGDLQDTALREGTAYGAAVPMRL